MKLTENDIGKTITILKKPPYWSSHFTRKDPLSLKYPFTGIVQKFHREGCLVAGYGFAIDYMNFVFDNTQIDYYY